MPGGMIIGTPEPMRQTRALVPDRSRRAGPIFGSSRPRHQSPSGCGRHSCFGTQPEERTNEGTTNPESADVICGRPADDRARGTMIA